ncbi:hypothetical protein KL918_002411 [Ogataea parapolymorpha]|uniref:Uncharacterized protein n=1 Tax=Ogataea parapolymorpha (strain ATCC 26012 / BCRC 20466 / JCM 22074 / NRRL Y-7560 / DL-1) TaxID=871575 RepID=W1QJL1_OGAPD|nr:hypothetical protein HPODL_02136 [Ogataea parapolymorpha DL-1]ESX02817.1 hypothetical protein HPODL_02136 [Ogataea parapolymorpha DL-1]KAG7867814.1 hypothetical protein KL918_002411 [Ogataea parapolymorpha]KAG7870745.1 hypothetical protein KL916_004793 [Ogataea parapolymorpha]
MRKSILKPGQVRALVKFLGTAKVDMGKFVTRGNEEVGLALDRVFGQLGLKRERPNLVAEVAKFETVSHKYEPIQKVPWFHFDPKKYIITQQDLDSAPGQVPDSPLGYVTKDTPIAANYQELRGVQSSLYSMAMDTRIGRVKPVYKCDYFALTYYPKSYYMGQIRKSRPGVMLQFDNHAFLNTLASRRVKIDKNLSKDAANYYPFILSVHRTKTSKFYRKTFFEHFTANNMIEKWDGLYRFQLYLRPVLKKDFENLEFHIRKSLEYVRRCRASPEPKARMDWTKINSVSEVYGLPPLVRQK